MDSELSLCFTDIDTWSSYNFDYYRGSVAYVVVSPFFPIYYKTSFWFNIDEQRNFARMQSL